MTLFLFLIACGVVVAVIAVRDRRRSRYDAFAAAAKEFGFAASSEGFLKGRAWIHGRHEGLDFRAEPYRVETDGNKHERMGYRVLFPERVAIPTQGGADPRLVALERLDTAFIQRQLTAESLFCARRSVPFAAEQLVEDVRNVLWAAKLLAKGPSSAASGPPPIPIPVPPPLPVADAASAVVAPQPPALPSARDIDADATSDLSSQRQGDPEQGLPQEGAAEGDDAEEQIDLARSAPPTGSNEAPGEEVVSSPEDEPHPADSLRAAAIDLFASGRNRYETQRRFDEAHLGKTVSGRACLRRVAPYSHDRVFGRGPGLLATMEIQADAADSGANGSGAAPSSGPVFLVAEVSSDDGSAVTAPERNAHVGEEHVVVGVLARCDAFSRTLYLCEALCEPEER